nr:ethylene-responsive transcription factor rap2-3 [Quercus suber]
MCGGAIISDFVDIKPRGRRTTTEDLWSELDTASDLFGFNSNSALDDFPNSFFHLKAPQKPKQLEKVRSEKRSDTDEKAKQPLIQNEICCKNEVAQFDHGFELKDQISSLESFLGLEPEPEPSLVSGSGSESMESVDLWMLDDLVTHHQQQRQLLY